MEHIEKLKERNLGKVIYTLIEIKNGDNNITSTQINKCLGQIEDIDLEGNFILHNPILNEKNNIHISELNKNYSNYYVSNVFLT